MASYLVLLCLVLSGVIVSCLVFNGLLSSCFLSYYFVRPCFVLSCVRFHTNPLHSTSFIMTYLSHTSVSRVVRMTTTAPSDRSHFCHVYPNIDTFTNPISSTSSLSFLLPLSWIHRRPRTDPVMIFQKKAFAFLYPEQIPSNGSMALLWIVYGTTR